ncbi:MAG: O-antigen ligase family protein [Vampirovibrionales bacterium]|jgi:putative inorganic carbon (HCO3(-)) transporter|nr:O-antigen ligase family protein [Vampirovibrionales bacterium]
MRHSSETGYPPFLGESKLFQAGVQGQACLHQWLISGWESSLLGRLCIQALARNVEDTDKNHASLWLGILPALAILGILIGVTFLGTGILGAAVLALGGFILLASVVSGRNAWVKHPHLLDALIILFFLTYAVSACFSSLQPQAFIGFIKQSIFLVAYLSFRSTWHHASSLLRWGFPLLLLLGAVQAVIGWLQVHGYAGELAGWTDANTPAELKLNRVYGTIKPYNPNLLAAFFVASSGAGLWTLLQVATKPFRFVFPWLLVISGLLTLVLYGVVMTGCRGAYLGVFVSMLALFMLSFPLLKTDTTLKEVKWLASAWVASAVLAIVAIAGVLFSSEKLMHRVTSIFAFRGDSSISYRMNVYISAWRMFCDNWLFGIGPSNTVFKKVYGYYMTPGFNALGAYSVPLEILVEQGILGFGVFLGIVGSVFQQMVQSLFNEKKALASKLSVLSLAVALLAFMGHGFFDTILYRPPIMLPFLFMLSALVTFVSLDVD